MKVLTEKGVELPSVVKVPVAGVVDAPTPERDTACPIVGECEPVRGSPTDSRNHFATSARRSVLTVRDLGSESHDGHHQHRYNRDLHHPRDSPGGPLQTVSAQTMDSGSGRALYSVLGAPLGGVKCQR